MRRSLSFFFPRPLVAFEGQARVARRRRSSRPGARRAAAALGSPALLALAVAALVWLLPSRPAETIPAPDAAGVPGAALAWFSPLAPLPLTARGAPAAQAEDSLRSAYARLPLGFVENRGQLDRRVRYHAQGPGFGFYLTKEQLVLSLRQGKRRGVALALGFQGASPQARLTARSELPGRVNYLRGKNPANWQTDLRSYGELRYHGLWPGIDMVLRGQRGRLKYEFHLAPGADPGRIRLAYRGAEGLSLGAGGALLVDTPLGPLRDSRPVSYQRVGGRRVPVESRFRLAPRQSNAYGFALGAGYDPRRPLVIDPTLAYSTFLGGGSFEQGLDVAVDAEGSAYVTGLTGSTDFPTTPGVPARSLGGQNDAFVTKLNPAGTAISYSTYLGGNGDAELGSGIAVDAARNAYVTGATTSTDFPTTPGAFDTSLEAGTEAFMTKLSPTGGLVSSTYLGGQNNDLGADIAVDGSGSAYVVGREFAFAAGDFPVTPGAFDTTLDNCCDAFVAKLNPSGSALSYSTYLGGDEVDEGRGIAVGSNGQAYVTGSTSSSDFPATAGADASLGGAEDAFVTRLNATGSALVYSTYLGGGGIDLGAAVAGDATGSAYVTGHTQSGDFPTTAGAYDGALGGPGDAFVAKLGAGAVLSYATYLGGSGFDGDADMGIALDAAGRAFVTGDTSSSDFPTTPAALDTTLGGSSDAFVAMLGATGSALVFSTYLGGGDFDGGNGIAVDAGGSAYVTGQTDSNDYPTTPGAYDTTLAVIDAFVTKLAPDALIRVAIDVKPGDAQNRINLRSRGVIPVAVLSTQGFDARSVDVRTVCFGDAENPAQRACSEAHGRGHPEDVDGDGDLDLVLHFRTQETGIDPGDTRACLTGATLDGRRIEGCDSIRTG